MNAIDNSWVLFKLAEQTYGLPTAQTLEMVVLRQVNGVPHSHPAMRGVINLRGTILPVIDLRHLLGMESRQKEIIELGTLLEARKQDHINWLEELNHCVRNKREFGLALDPTQCRFGRWYYQFETDNPELKVLLPRFERPHNRIHLLGSEVVEHMRNGQQREAIALVEGEGSGILSRLLELFDDTIKTVRTSANEIVIVVQVDGRKVGIIVDDVDEVSEIQPEAVRDPHQAHGSFPDFLSGVTTGADHTQMLLSVEKVIQGLTLPDASRISGGEAPSP